MRWESYHIKLKELKNMPPRMPQLHIQKTKDKTGSPHYLNIPHPSKRCHGMKYWLMHASLTNCSYSNIHSCSTLKNLSFPIMTKVLLVAFSLIIGCCKCICSSGVLLMAINNSIENASKSILEKCRISWG